MTTYQINSQKTYIFLVKENIALIKRLIDESKSKAIAFDPNNTDSFYRSRALHLQTMALLGLTCEHLLKLILLKRGYSINEIDYIKNISSKLKIKYADRAIPFYKAISLFKKSNPNNYFDGVEIYEFNTHDTDYEYSYLGRKKISPTTCINLIQKIRNGYVHKADPRGEWNGVVWYVYNFILWLAKKEFNKHFLEYKFIGNQEIIGLFAND